LTPVPVTCGLQMYFKQDMYFSQTQQFITQNYAHGNMFRI